MRLFVLGNLDAVIAGNVCEQMLECANMSSYAYALGGGAKVVGGDVRVGEMLVFDHKGYIYTPEEAWNEQEQLATPFLMGIDAKPKTSIEVGEYASLDQLYQTLLKRWKSGFAIVGECHFKMLATTYLKCSPIYHEDVLENQAKYWGREEYANCFAHLFAVALPHLDKHIFYDNPNEKSKRVCHSHTHVLINNQVRHLLTHSSIKRAKLWIESV